MRLPYFQSSSPQFQVQCLQLSTDMMGTAGEKERITVITGLLAPTKQNLKKFLYITTCGLILTLFNSAVSTFDGVSCQMRRCIVRNWKGLAYFKALSGICLKTEKKHKEKLSQSSG